MTRPLQGLHLVAFVTILWNICSLHCLAGKDTFSQVAVLLYTESDGSSGFSDKSLRSCFPLHLQAFWDLLLWRIFRGRCWEHHASPWRRCVMCSAGTKELHRPKNLLPADPAVSHMLTGEFQVKRWTIDKIETNWLRQMWWHTSTYNINSIKKQR